MSDVILVLNAGSSSIKFSLFAAQSPTLDLLARGQIEGLFTQPHFIAKNPAGEIIEEKHWHDGPIDHNGAVDHLSDFLRGNFATNRLVGVGHRVVHGGPEYAQPVRIDKALITSLEMFVPLAPLHQPHNLMPIRRLLQRQPQLPQIACFDTAFHRSNPELAQRFALPEALYAEGVRRYGFHGLSYEFISGALPAYDTDAARGKVVVLHLGNGASMCALNAGVSVASTMGFTAVDGLPMGTRCGAVDPGVILFLLDQKKMDPRAIEKMIYSQSGLLGVSGISSDMRALLDSKEPRAALAIDLFIYRVNRELGSLAAALGGLDAIVFTGGIGENSPIIRARILNHAQWLGVQVDASANEAGEARLSRHDSRVSAWKIPTNEELMIARHTYRLLSTG